MRESESERALRERGRRVVTRTKARRHLHYRISVINVIIHGQCLHRPRHGGWSQGAEVRRRHPARMSSLKCSLHPMSVYVCVCVCVCSIP